MRLNVNGIFNPQNRFWSFMEKITDLCLLSLLWCLASLPVVTAGAATTALFQYTLRLTANEEGYVFKTFKNGFVKNFVQSTVLWLVAVVAGAFLVTDLYFCQFLAVPVLIRRILFLALVSLLIVYLLTMVYLFPLLAFFHTGSRKLIRDAFIMSVGNLYISVTILVIYGVAAVATWFIPVLFMVWFTLASYGASHFYRSVFLKYVEED